MSEHGRITRRDLLRGATAATIAALGSRITSAAPPTRPPNIIFILADDLGYADISCYGRSDLRTPNIDRIAASGIRFMQAYANSPVCTASRVALITGRYQYRVRVGLEEPLAGNPDIGLSPEHPTMPSLLKKAGYSTTLIGKWHLGAPPKYGPLKSGYDHFYGFRGGALDYYTHQSNGKEDLWDDDVPIHQNGYLTELLGERAVQVIKASAKSSKPFFISLHFNAPHWPWEAPGDQAEAERLAKAGGSLFHADGGTQKTYQRMIKAMDLQVGRVLDAIKAHRLSDNTIVIFTSDNGGERYADTWPFTGKKTELLEGGIRIPAVISWPARIPRGRTTEQVCMNMDWLATLLAAAGGAPDPAYPVDGINLLPQLTQNAAPVPRKVFWRYKGNAQHAVRDGDFKFLKILDNTFLFNVIEDPLERANLKGRQKEVYDRLRRDWFAWNSGMLPEVKESYTATFDGKAFADHYGAKPPDPTPDNPASPDD